MFKDRDEKKTLDHGKLNEVIGLTQKILKVLFILLIILISWVALAIIRDLKIWSAFLSILKILSPLFIGVIIAWLFNPFVKMLEKHRVKRIFGVIISYVLLVGGITLFLGAIIPVLYEQIIDFVATLPSLFKTMEEWLEEILSKFSDSELFDIGSLKADIIRQMDVFGQGLKESLPSMIINTGSTIFSGFSTFVVGLVIGFFLLLGFDDVEETFIYLFPKHMRKDADTLFGRINGTLRDYVRGVLLDAMVIFGICFIVFSVIGLRAPLLFAAFCAITNVIPYVGPYIGAVPAVIVGFSMSPTIGLLVTGAIVVIQFIEGNFLQELILSKTTKLHPVTIITGLLIFQHFWGIIGMVVSTPIIAILKIIFQFVAQKWNLFDYVDEED